MYTLVVTGETIAEIIGKLNRHIKEFEALHDPLSEKKALVVEIKEIHTTPARQPVDIVKNSIAAEGDDVPTFVQVKQKILDLAKNRGRNASLEVLKEFGVEKITALKPDQYAAVMESADKVLNA